MAHHNNTPESVLNAPKSEPIVLVGHMRTKYSYLHQCFTKEGVMDPTTGVYINTTKQKRKRQRRNKR